MVFRLPRRRRRAGLLVSGSLLIASLYYFGGSSRTTTASLPSSAPPTDRASSAPKKAPPPHRDDNVQKPILNLELPSMAYGVNARPPLKDLATLIADLPREHVPSLDPESGASKGGLTWSASKAPKARRLVFVGDVHGQLSALQELLGKVGFDREAGDHLVLTGDLVNKGPDSRGVVQLAMDLGASAVRGNHEDRLLLVHKAMKHPDISSIPDKNDDDTTRAEAPTFHVGSTNGGSGTGGWFGSWLGRENKQDTWTVTELERTPVEKADAKAPPAATASVKTVAKVSTKASRGDEAFRALAATLSDEQIAWLSALPAILRVGRFPTTSETDETPTAQAAPWDAELLVVHAGLVPHLALDRQDPWAVTHVRSLQFPAEALRHAQVKAYLKARNKERYKQLNMPVRDELVDQELARLHRTLPAATWADDQRVSIPDEGRGGTSWSDVWNEVQNNEVARARDRTVVIYGHDAKAGLNVELDVQVEDVRVESAEAKAAREAQERAAQGWFARWTKAAEPEKKRMRPGTRYAFGLDSGCVYGKQLTALVLEAAGGDEARSIVHRIVQVDCPKAVDPDDKKKKKT